MGVVGSVLGVQNFCQRAAERGEEGPGCVTPFISEFKYIQLYCIRRPVVKQFS